MEKNYNEKNLEVYEMYLDSNKAKDYANKTWKRALKSHKLLNLRWIGFLKSLKLLDFYF